MSFLLPEAVTKPGTNGLLFLTGERFGKGLPPPPHKGLDLKINVSYSLKSCFSEFRLPELTTFSWPSTAVRAEAQCVLKERKASGTQSTTGASSGPSRTGLHCVDPTSRVGSFPVKLHRKPWRWQNQEQVTVWKQDSIS